MLTSPNRSENMPEMWQQLNTAVLEWMGDFQAWEQYENIKWIFLATVGTFAAYQAIKRLKREAQLPPGPTGWPWLGYTPCLRDGGFREAQALSKKYGPVTSFRVCGKLMVILSDEESIKEAALKNRALIGRFTMLGNHSLARGYGLFNYDGETAAALRRTLVGSIYKIMPETANGKGAPDNVLNAKIDSECAKLINGLKNINSKPIPVTLVFRKMMWQVIWKISFGTDCPLDDDTVTMFVQCIGYINANIGPFQLKQMLPHLLTGIVRRSKTVRKLVGADDLFDCYLPALAAIKETVASLWSSPDRSPDCLLTHFIENKEYDMSPAHASQLLLEVMAAGVDTTALSMVWCCHALANGKLQLKPGEEFTEEKLEEVHRLASVVPMALPHTARFDSYIGGYLIPKDSIVMYNLYSVHQEQLKDIELSNKSCPHNKKEGASKKLYFCETALPFSIGGRSCPGFMLATHMLMRVISDLTNEYKVIQGDNAKNIPQPKLNGITRPQPADSYRFIARA